MVKSILMLVLVFFVGCDRSYAMPPEKLFESKWSEKCANKQGVETSEYIVFSELERCRYFVDTFRVQSRCEKAEFKELDNNRLLMTVENEGIYIIEFLWSSQISIMEVITETPLILKQNSILGRAEIRDSLMTNYLYCP